MKEEWLMPGAVVPVDVETTAALVAEIKRLISVVGGMALNQQRTWVGLTNEDRQKLADLYWSDDELTIHSLLRIADDKLREKNGGGQ